MDDIGSFFVDSVRRKWILGISINELPSLQNIESWLLNGSYIWLPSPLGTAKFDIRNSSPSLSEAIASEISRFSCAAYESLLDSEPSGTSVCALGWPLVRHYYASFYCAHALLRIAGLSLTYLSGMTASKLNQVGGQYLGIMPQITAGLHALQSDPNNKNIITLRKVSSANGGSHEEMWKLFLQLLIEVENLIIQTQGQTPSAMETVDTLKELRNHLCWRGKNNGEWPSFIRNSVNYRHEYGVWFPYLMCKKDGIILTEKMKQWRPGSSLAYEIGKASGDLERFADISKVITHLLTDTLLDISKRSPRAGKSFVDRYPFKLLRLRQISV